MADQQKAFDRFRRQYNEERPHEALGQKTPARFYEPSRRRLPMPPWGRDFEYGERFEALRVTRTGFARFQGATFFVSTSLHHELIGVEAANTGGWSVYFGPTYIGRLDRVPRSRRIRFTPAAEVSPMSSDKPSPMSVK